MSAQRIVVTSPWKLGLFVFLLVAGCGFGLIYAYLEYFGGTLDFSDPESLKLFYGVCGGVALLGLIGYLAVVAAAQPLDRVVHGGKRRQKLLKAAGGVDDPFDVDLEDFQDEPQLIKLIERWRDDRESAQGAMDAGARQREAVSNLAQQLQQSIESGVEIPSEGAEGGTSALITAVNETVAELRTLRGSRSHERGQTGHLKDACTSALEDLRVQRDRVNELARSLSAMDGSSEGAAAGQSGPVTVVPSVEDLLLDSNLQGACKRNRERIGELRGQLEKMADEANKLAINAALQVSRLGEAGAPLLEAMDQLRSISSSFQKLVADLRLCENDQEMTEGQVQTLVSRVQREWSKLVGGGGDGEGPVSLAAVVAGLAAVSASIEQKINQLTAAMEGSAQAASQQSPGPAGTAEASNPEEQLAQIHDELFHGKSAHSGATIPAPSADADAEDDVYDLSDFGAVELQEESSGDAQGGDRIYDLNEFGAVEI